jgi:hypothetical protein
VAIYDEPPPEDTQFAEVVLSGLGGAGTLAEVSPLGGAAVRMSGSLASFNAYAAVLAATPSLALSVQLRLFANGNVAD